MGCSACNSSETIKPINKKDLNKPKHKVLKLRPRKIKSYGPGEFNRMTRKINKLSELTISTRDLVG